VTTTDTAPLILVAGPDGEPMLIPIEPAILPGSALRFWRPASLSEQPVRLRRIAQERRSSRGPTPTTPAFRICAATRES
jgi:hypothetical protein